MADDHSDDPAPQRRLIVLGCVSLGLYAAVAVLSRRFAIDVPSAERPHLGMFALFGVLFAVYLLALRTVGWHRRPLSESSSETQRRSLAVVIGFAVAYRLLLLGTTPIQEIDLYRYLWDGNVVASGISPYRFSPQEVRDTVARSGRVAQSGKGAEGGASSPGHAADDVQRLVQRSPALAEILQTIHFADLTTPYPPVSQAVFALAALTTPDAATSHTHLVVMKAWIVLFDLLTILAVIGLLRATRLPTVWCLAYAWCPLVMKEFANSGHLDAIAVCLTTVGLWQLVTARDEAPRLLRAAVLVGLGVGAKLYPIVLLPVTIAWVLSRRGWRSAVIFGFGVLLVAGITLWPMMAVERDSPSGLRAFLARWQMNDLLFRIVDDNLDPSWPRSKQAWFAVVPDYARMAIVSPMMEWLNVDARTAAFLLTRIITLVAFASIVGWLTWRTIKSPEAQQETRHLEDAGSRRFLEAAFLTLAWFWLLAPTQNPWYWTWCLPLLPFARSRVWLWVGGMAMVYYLRFWFNACWPDPPGPLNGLGGSWNGASFFDYVVVWCEHGPIFCGLLVGWLIGRRQQ